MKAKDVIALNMYMMHKESTIPFKIYANMPKQCPKRKKRKKKKKEFNI